MQKFVVATLCVIFATIGVALMLGYNSSRGMIVSLDLVCTYVFAFYAALQLCIRVTDPEADHIPGWLRSFGSVLVFGAIASALASVGGGALRKAASFAIADLVKLADTSNPVWAAIQLGWISGIASGYGLSAIARDQAEKTLDVADAFGLGVFAVAGFEAALSLEILYLGPLEKLLFFIQIPIIGLCAAFTGAGGGLLRDVLVYAVYRIVKMREAAAEWPLRRYTQLGFAVGVFSHYVLKAIRIVFDTGAFAENTTLTLDTLGRAVWAGNMFGADGIVSHLLTGLSSSEDARRLLVYLVAGFLAAAIWQRKLKPQAKPAPTGTGS